MIIAIFVFFGLLILGMPIGFVLGITATIAIYTLGMPELLSLVASRFYSGSDLFPLMAMPLFILAGEIMNRTGITLRVIDFANVLVGHIRGGLGHANILASVFFAGLTGSLLALIASWILSVYFFEILFFPDFLSLGAIWILVLFLTVFVGWLNTKSILNKSPLEVLRKEV